MIKGKNLIQGEWSDSEKQHISSTLNGQTFAQASDEQVDLACRAARACFRSYSRVSRSDRANFLRTIAQEIDSLGEDITLTAMAETGLPRARLEGERGRTIHQLKQFADLIESEQYLDIRHSAAQPERTPPAPELHLMQRSIGPVAVFGASNFPLAFSSAGGDTASALAAGCPVVVKGHGAHPGTCDLVAQAILTAIERCNMPVATFQQVQGEGFAVGQALVNHPEITAVGFTGSLAGGRALYNQCHARPTPIPFYGELGSINPVFCLPTALAKNAESIGTGWAASLTMGAGQFCTNPGVLIGLAGDDFNKLQDAAVAALNDAAPQIMLSDGIHAAYCQGVDTLASHIEEVTSGQRATGERNALPAVFRVDATRWIDNPELQHEVFGAAGLLITCNDTEQMQQLAEQLQGQLTITLFLEPSDEAIAAELLPIIEEKAGRLLCNNYPTGVEVSPAMMHGGPYPASTDVRSTSVGTLAIARWLRPVSYQNMPQSLLPPELQN